MATITTTGITGTTLLEYKELLDDSLLSIDSGWNINPESPDGQKNASDAEALATLDEQIIDTYASIDPNTAVGAALDRISYISGLERQDATYSTALVTFAGVNGTLIPAGTQVRNKTTSTLWATQTTATIASGTASVTVAAVEAGAKSASIGDLSIIATPIGGAQTVTNAAPAILGSDEESDAVYRVRRNLSVANPGDNQVDSLFAQIANVAGVTKLKIYENFESATDANGVLDHSMVILVAGGEPEDIASQIAKKSPGCGLNSTEDFGDEKLVIETTTPIYGSPFTATFFRPTSVPIYVKITAVGNISETSIAAIKENVVKYANATLFSDTNDGFDRTGFDIGEVVAAGKLFSPANQVIADKGYAVSITIGTDSGDVTYNTVDPSFDGVGVFDEDNIEVIVS